MSLPNNDLKIREILFNIFQEMTEKDVKAANFFIRSETGKKSEDVFELMEILEKLAYFQISPSKVQVEKLIDLLGYIRRNDLQDQLQRQAKTFCFNNTESNASAVSNGDEGPKRKFSDSGSTAESSLMESNASVLSNGDEEPKSKLSDFESNEENSLMESNASFPSNGDEEPKRKLSDFESTEENSLMESNASIPSNGNDEPKRKLSDFESTEENSLMVDNQESSAAILSNGNDDPKSKLSVLKPTEEMNLISFDDTNDCAASNFTENKTVNRTPQHSSSIEELTRHISLCSLDPFDTPKSTKKRQLDSSSVSSNVENNSNATSSRITLYNYQNELAENGKRGINSIICSPTGSGKTITAASVIRHQLENAEKTQVPYRVLYLVHIRYLVRHLAVDLKKILNDAVYPFEDSDILSSGVVKGKAVVILTAQILYNALNNKSVSLSDYDLLVFDECHNTTLNHPYNAIMKKYHETKRGGKKVPQILGLSGTLGGGTDPFKAIVSLCANMDTFWVSCVRDENNKKELSEKNKLPIIDEVIEGKVRVPDDFSENIDKAIKAFVIILETDYNYKMDNCTSIGNVEFGGYMSTQKSICEINNLREEVKILEFLIIMNKALIYYNELTAIDAYEYLQNTFIELDTCNLPIERKIASVYEMTLKEIEEFSLNDKFENNNKLLKLQQLLTKILMYNPEKKVILLCLTRFNAAHLKERISENRDLKKFVKADYIIGQSGDDGLTPKQQANVLKKFEKDDINLLIATSIAEQGLNIPDCEIVIRYMYVTSDISRRQAQGRARKENSQYYLIADENSDQIYRDCRNKTLEAAMAIALQKIMDMGEKVFEQTVTEKIEELYSKADENKRMQDNHRYIYKAHEVEILCKECHRFLCYGSDIIKKGSEYICTNPDFESKVISIRTSEMCFRLDSKIGNSKCNGNNCSMKFGAIKKYFHGERQTGFVLNIKSILFKYLGVSSLAQLKKWSKHDFPIEEEVLV